jgi:hypothetical protein
MTNMICPTCEAWRFCDSDRYCGQCGASLLVARARISPAFIFEDQSVTEVKLSVVNAGSGSLEGSEIEVRSATNGTVALKAQIPDGALRGNDGSPYPLTLPVRDLAKGGGQQRWEVRHRSESGQGEGSLLGQIHVNLPVPRLELPEAELTLDIANPDDPVPLTTELALRLVTRADGAEVQSVFCEVPQGMRMPAPRIEGVELPAVLAADTPWRLPLHISAELTRLLINQPGGSDFNLVASFTGREQEEQNQPVRIPFRLRVPSPARPVLELTSERYIGMAGSDIRIRAVVRNRGGAPCQLAETELHLRRGSETVRSLHVKTPGRAQPIPPGAERAVEVSLPLLGEDGSDLSGRIFALEWHQSYEGGLAAQRRGATIEVSPAEAFQGIVSVDFGTTATAVAVHRNGQPVPSPARLGEHTDYLPTAILYYLDDDGRCRWVIGDDAQRRLAETGDDYKFYYDNLKLHLNLRPRERQLLPDGSERTWAGITADYLRALRARLEGDPMIAAVIGAVHPTHPATFPPLATDALLNAYREADMEPHAYRLKTGGSVVMSESWPQVLLQLPLPQLAELRRLAFGDPDMPGDDPRRFGLMSFDVGGGTTDMSLFDVDIMSRAEVDIEEVATDSDFSFSGNGFADLIAEGLVAACDRWLTARGFGPTRETAPFVLPWSDRDIATTTAVQLENGRAIAALARLIQHSNGPLNRLRDRIEAIESVRQAGGWATISMPADPTQDPFKAVRQAWTTVGDAMTTTWPLPTPPPVLRLRLERGTEIEIPWGKDGAHLDLGAFYEAFVTGLVDRLSARMRGLFEAAKARDLDLVLVVSGRGSLFPAVSQILYELAQRHYDLGRVRFLGVGDDFLKGIVAYGTSLLGRIARFAHDISFKPLSLAKLCVASGLDQRTGRQRLIAVADGMPNPEDGRCVSAEPIPFPPGPAIFTAELYLSPRFDGLLDFDRDMSLASFSAKLHLDAADAERVFVAVERTGPHCLRGYVAWPAGAAGETPTPDWHWQEIGRYADGGDGCAEPPAADAAAAPSQATHTAAAPPAAPAPAGGQGQQAEPPSPPDD